MASKPKAYRVSRQAAADLESIYAYTLENWSLAQADSYYAQIIAAFEGVIAGLKFGRPAAIPGYLTLRVRSHVIFYREAEDCVFITRVLHKAMDAPRHLGGS